MKGVLGITVAAVLLVPIAASAQDRPARWERRGEATQPRVAVFHSTQSANLPTTETLARGEWLFEISHRFSPTISQGADALWGLDGPVNNRLGLAYAITDGAMIGVQRSNQSDNVDINAKVRVVEGGGTVPFQVAVGGGVAWNTETPDAAGYDENEMQAYGQLVVNARLGGRVAVGAVPTFVHNPRLADLDSGSAFVLGLHGQAYVSQHVSFFGEWIVTEERTGQEHDLGTLGIELETGGHFFKVVVSNGTGMNPTQHLVGTPYAFALDQMRLGFNVTRILTF